MLYDLVSQGRIGEFVDEKVERDEEDDKISVNGGEIKSTLDDKRNQTVPTTVVHSSSHHDHNYSHHNSKQDFLDDVMQVNKIINHE